jgi:hypothetical protein
MANMEVLSPKSLINSVIPPKKSRAWTYEMFDALVANVRAAVSAPGP